MADNKKLLRVVAKEDFSLLKPEEVATHYVTKDDFFALTCLSEMTEPGAAEGTYGRWVMNKRITENREVEEDPTGLTDDKVRILIPARFVNAEKRRVGVNRREAEKARALAQGALAPGLRA